METYHRPFRREARVRLFRRESVLRERKRGIEAASDVCNRFMKFLPREVFKDGLSPRRANSPPPRPIGARILFVSGDRYSPRPTLV